MPERVVTGLNDTITSEANPTNTYEARPTLTIRNVTGKRLFAFVKAAGITPRPDAQVSSAVLRLFPTHDFPSTTFVIRRASKDWSASRTWWDNQPSLGTVVLNHTAAGVAGQPFDIPITATVAAWLAGSVPNTGLRIETTGTAAGGYSFHSMNATGTLADFKPRIVMNVTAPPAAPTDITPSGGGQVSTADPLQTWRYGGEDVPAMAAYQIQTFTGAVSIASSGVFSRRVASFNVNGVQGAPTSFESRLNGLGQTIVNSGAAAVGLQECSDNVTNQPALLLAKVKELSGNTAWTMFVGPNLNCLLIDTARLTPLWPTTSDKGLGDGKWASALMVQDVTAGVPVILWVTHYLTSSELTKQIAHTRVLIPWLKGLYDTFGVPLIGTGDFNAKDKSATRPMGMLALAGHSDVRDLVEPEDITNRTYNSHDSYGANGMNGWWIDHVLVYGGTRPTAVGLVDSGTASDHNLVYATVEYVGSRPMVAGLGEPTSDTGEIASSVPQHQYTGVTDPIVGRIRHKSVEGRWSDWSVPFSFGYAPLPTVTITSDDPTTNDPTPTTTWTTTGVQAEFQVILRRVDTGEIVADSGRLQGAGNQWQPSDPISVDPTAQLTREVRVWDDQLRVPAANAPTFARAISDPFTIVPGVGTAPTAVEATPVGPAIDLSWSLASTPDSFIVERRIDGKAWVRFPVEVGDVAQGGSAYLWRDVTAPPEHDLAYRVRAVTNGSMGQASVVAEKRLKPGYIWLADPDDPTWLLAMAGRDAGEWTLPEDSTVVEVIGSDRVNVIYEGARGYEGSVSGLFVSDVPGMLDLSAQSQRDKVWDIKRKPTHVWRLSIGDMNIPVILRQATPVPRPGPEVSFGVSAAFYQQGELAWADA